MTLRTFDSFCRSCSSTVTLNSNIPLTVVTAYGLNQLGLDNNMLTSYMDDNFNKYSNVSFLTVVCTVFRSSKNHIQVLNRSSKPGAALVNTIASSIKVSCCQ